MAKKISTTITFIATPMAQSLTNSSNYLSCRTVDEMELEKLNREVKVKVPPGGNFVYWGNSDYEQFASVEVREAGGFKYVGSKPTSDVSKAPSEWIRSVEGKNRLCYFLAVLALGVEDAEGKGLVEPGSSTFAVEVPCPVS